jgi:hypothetical protein
MDTDGLLKLYFQPLKRTFGEHKFATRFQNMVKEMVSKVSLHNLFREMVSNR